MSMATSRLYDKVYGCLAGAAGLRALAATSS